MIAKVGQRPCPICAAPDPFAAVYRESLPIFQNVVYPTREAALCAPQASFLLSTCITCGFSYNGLFDAQLVVYDESYDNAVPSQVFKDYYRSLVQMMIDRFDLTSGKVYDIGCGKGEFLQLLCETAPNIRGVGIDPSCEPVGHDNFELIQAFFEPSHFAGDTKLILLRHVLEHIEEPVSFLAELRAAAPAGATLYVEVPDLDWILDGRVFWDFCYEHCNYFTPATLADALSRAGWTVQEQQPSFGNQYQWAIAKASGERAARPAEASRRIERIVDYDRSEQVRLTAIRERAAAEGSLTLWGMATKGVILSHLLGPEFVKDGVDVNPDKQERFAAGSGTLIHPPEWIADLPAGSSVLVMNPNYLGEIARYTDQFGVKAILLE